MNGSAGARAGRPSWLRSLVAMGALRDLRALVVPGPEVARARGLDLDAAGLRIAVTPRHANVLLLVGRIPPELADAAVVLYAQMMRPRAVFALGSGEFPSLPVDVATPLSQHDLLGGARRLRTILAQGVFRAAVADFSAPVLEARTEYTCPMHPEVVQNEPGSCPKCGMALVPRETQAGEAIDAAVHQHGDAAGHSHAQHQPVPDNVETTAMTHEGTATYTCPMHPEVVQNAPGSCPKCGMALVPREMPASEAGDVAAHQHGDAAGHAHDHHDPDGVKPAVMTDEKAAVYTCPMHPEVVQATPGSCPKCGMTLVLQG